MLWAFVKQNNLQDRVLKIINLNDNPDDDQWYRNLYKKTGDFDVTLGNNPWNNGIIQRHGKKVIQIGFHNREELEGIQIRNLMKENLPWESRVPKYLLEKLKKTN